VPEAVGSMDGLGLARPQRHWAETRRNEAPTVERRRLILKLHSRVTRNLVHPCVPGSFVGPLNVREHDRLAFACACCAEEVAVLLGG